ncbi:YebC/PmpR family DNA-binding transcriptional regulator [Patescibacteria group bacterium AH-259-L07]|nr:YebC/PmpR family DNA-binding transcriptional regulator [Patescibacteria group bacterium AH-259-L07]
MSGHSRWSKLKHSKGASDAKKSAMFTKLGHLITIAARVGGGDPEANFKLRIAIEKAKKANLPKDNIDRAIKRGTGELAGEKIEEVMYEAFGPGGSAIVIETLTDNKNRTIGSLRRIFNKYGGKLGEQNSVLWMFSRYGIIRVVLDMPDEKKQDIQLKAIETGAQDISEEDDELVIYTSPEDLEKVKKDLEKEGIEIDYAEVEWFAKDLISISEQAQKKVDSIFEELDDEPDVSDYYTNIK